MARVQTNGRPWICPEHQSNIVLHKDFHLPSSGEQKQISEYQKSPHNRIVTLTSAAQGTDLDSRKVACLMSFPSAVMKYILGLLALLFDLVKEISFRAAKA